MPTWIDLCDAADSGDAQAVQRILHCGVDANQRNEVQNGYVIMYFTRDIIAHHNDQVLGALLTISKKSSYVNCLAELTTNCDCSGTSQLIYRILCVNAHPPFLMNLWFICTSSFARFALSRYCGHGFAHFTHFTSYGNPECMSEVVKLNT